MFREGECEGKLMMGLAGFPFFFFFLFRLLHDTVKQFIYRHRKSLFSLTSEQIMEH